MYPMNFHRLCRRAKVLSAVFGATAVVTTGALSAVYQSSEVGADVASSGWQVPTVTSTPSAALETPFASPTLVAGHAPCPPRVSYPC
jgi:hypothetical protein